MIKIDFANLTQISTEHGLSDLEINSQNHLLEEYLGKIHNRKQGFYEILDDQETLDCINEFAKKATKEFDHIIVLGIGGSALGTICIQQSLTHLYQNQLKSIHPKIHVIDNIDPVLIQEIQDIIDLRKTLFIVVTKSGGTPETLSTYFYFQNLIKEANLETQKHFVFITDPEKGLLRELSQKQNIPAFNIPENVGGRFSVLTPVGLLPAALMNLNIEKLIAGANSIKEKFLNTDPEQNLPFQLASIQYQLTKKNKNINVMMPYAQKLIRFADWYRQLLAESIGKKFNNDGEEVYVGITPVNALGVTDQHSQNQLYNEGPNDKLFMLIKVADPGVDQTIPHPNHESLNYLDNTSFKTLLHTEMLGTTQALTKNDRPNITLEIDKLSEHTLGALFLLFEASTAFLGEFFNINAFDQPGVELSKNITKELLKN